jgi:hypothetical protein
MDNDPDLLEEYDFSGGIRGKYAEQYREGSNIVILDPDIAEMFPDSAAANQALHALAQIIQYQSKRRSQRNNS